MMRDKAWLETLYPGYFAQVMATGIVSVAAHDFGLFLVSRLLWLLAAVFYPCLVVLYVLRAVRYRKGFGKDLTAAPTMFAFFTFVAGGDVLGTRSFLGGYPQAAQVLWIVSALAWLALVYTTMSILFFRNERPLAESVNGSWLILIVATQSLVILGTLIFSGTGRDGPFFGLTVLWAIGVVFYLVFISFIIAGLGFSPVQPRHLTPPYWINMGATAISTVAGVALLNAGATVAVVRVVGPFIAGMTVLLWSWGTWWIPALVTMGIWRHFVRRHPLTYDPALWGMVFPLGMYTVACFSLGSYFHLRWLVTFAGGFVWVALAAWLFTFGGLALSLGAGRGKPAALADADPGRPG